MHTILPPLILAENFDGLYRLLFGIPIGCVLLAAVSFLPAAYGHWSTPVLAWPAIIFGLLLFLSLAPAGAPGWMLLFALAPVGIGVASLTLWRARRKREG